MEQFPYDAHTHTSASDGRNTAEENVRAAEAVGLRCVALTDHLYPETSHEELARRVATARALDRCSSVTVVAGAEAVILDTEGTVSVDEQAAQMLDLVLADVGARTRGVALEPPASPTRYEENVLAAVENAACNSLVDVIAHPFNLGRFPAVLTPAQLSRDALKRVARTMADNNVAFEIMNQVHWWYPYMTVEEFTREYVGLLRIFASEGVKFVVGSDTHSCCGVGNLHYCRRLMREAGIELSQLVDLERMVAVRQAQRSRNSAGAP
jgi:histidinol phosphatase-like PHP family hydrolase